MIIFTKQRARYGNQEKNKKRFRGSGWKCLLCDKMFRAEHWLDVHMASR